jgi:hypothetical protein
MSVLSTVINILAVIGLIVILAYVIYYLWDVLQKKNKNMIESRVNPPSEYMQQSGIKCPDYWVNTGSDSSGNYLCKNSYDVSVVKSSNTASCSSVTSCNNANKEVAFSPLPTGKTWQSGNPNGLTSLTDDEKYSFVTTKGPAGVSRCDWIKCCGASNSGTSTNNAIWLGVNEICNKPPKPM